MAGMAGMAGAAAALAVGAAVAVGAALVAAVAEVEVLGAGFSSSHPARTEQPATESAAATAVKREARLICTS
jgi:hypothetical protein